MSSSNPESEGFLIRIFRYLFSTTSEAPPWPNTNGPWGLQGVMGGFLKRATPCLEGIRLQCVFQQRRKPDGPRPRH
jgi:hypothetical protein